MIKCICVNDKHKPDNIPKTHWVKVGEEYTVMMIYPLVQPDAIMGVILQEIDLKETTSTFECFKIERFGFRQEDIPALERMIENCQGLQNFDPLKLISEEVLVGNNLDDFADYVSFEGEDDNLDQL